MGSIWFCLVAVLLTGYVVLDGLDIGAGILHLWIARNEAERSIVIRTIGPVWNGNEVWLLAAGGTLYFAFPALYATSFSGFYLPLMMVLWLLIFRGIALEFRGHIGGPIWPPLWDACFTVSSLLLAVFYGAALGNVVRGVPLDAAGRFFEPLWTNFLPAGQTGILDWYTIFVALVAVATLTLHGATWLACKTEGELSERALRFASRAWWLVALLIVSITFTSFRLIPLLILSFRVHPWGFIFLGSRDCWTSRRQMVRPPQTGCRGVWDVVSFYHGNACERCLQSLSRCASGEYNSGLQFDGFQMRRRPIMAWR